eukprot:TRINITY_DN8695_c0_g1_i1.p1 TRINITY_DN8695_c0_g1~~TRINITY_DN8695_c0_g1_i1.p1  ORF type:complete len:467 (+),score=97.21 TRINITY_DN8695_c0_g1_i1:69-1469(+)
MTESVSRRELILKEILQTEKAYVADLKTIIEVYKEELEAQGIISREQSKIIFANVEDLEVLNRTQVLEKFQKRFTALEVAGMPISGANMGDIFLHLADHLKWYTDYCANQPHALSMLKQLETENPEFTEYCNNLMNDPNGVVRGLSILSFIIKPVQRLCKYPLLLRELIAHTDPGTPEYQKLIEAAAQVNSTVELVNETQKKTEEETAEKLKNIGDIEKLISGAEKLQLASDTNRCFVMQGTVKKNHPRKKKLTPHQIFLFNNLVVIAAIKKKKKTLFLDWWAPISEVTVVDLSNSEDSQNAFTIERKQQLSKTDTKEKDEMPLSVVISCDTLAQKREWIKEVKRLYKDYQLQEVQRRITRGNGGNTGTSSRNLRIRSDSKFTEVEFGLSRVPSPPSSDGVDPETWRKAQSDLDNGDYINPPHFKIPGRWTDWLSYYSEEFGFPYFYHIPTQTTSWTQPQGWPSEI